MATFLLRSLRDANDRHGAGDAISLSLTQASFSDDENGSSKHGLFKWRPSINRGKTKVCSGIHKTVALLTGYNEESKVPYCVLCKSSHPRTIPTVPHGVDQCQSMGFDLADTYLEMGRRASAGSTSKGRKWTYMDG
jgi:hypothetical protein